MKTILSQQFPAVLLCLSALISQPSASFAQNTAFTYQGRLNDSGDPVNGRYDFIFSIFDAASGGSSLGGSVNASAVAVSNGLFTVALDFGSLPFTGPPRWLQISVSTNGVGSFTTLAPRQEITRAPYATFANTAATVTDGAIANAQLAVNAVGPANLQSNAVRAGQIASGQVVKSLNGLADAVSLTQGANVTINTVGNSLQISAPAGGLALPFSGTASSSGPIFTLANSGAGPAGVFVGKVGIGSSNPAARLEINAPVVGDGVKLSGTSPAYYLSDAGRTNRATFAYASAGGFFSTDAAAGDSVLRTESGKLLLQNGIFGSALALNNNQVGIGTTTPAAKLHVSNGDLLSGAPGEEWIFHTRSSFGGDFLHITDRDAGVPQFQRGLQLDQSGNLRLRNANSTVFATGGEENLRIVRGTVFASGAIQAGSGFTVSRTRGATYNITFTTPFSGTPTVTASLTPTENQRFIEVSFWNNTLVQITTFEWFFTILGEEQQEIPENFHFIAVGPR